LRQRAISKSSNIETKRNENENENENEGAAPPTDRQWIRATAIQKDSRGMGGIFADPLFCFLAVLRFSRLSLFLTGFI
jgi:hypothetical protein